MQYPPAYLSASSPAVEFGLPRPRHFEFAHRLLPGYAFREPAYLLQQLRDNPGPFLRGLWVASWAAPEVDLPEHLDDATPSTGFPVRADIDFGVGFYGALIWMPTPRRVTESYAVAIASTDGEVRYFTIEAGVPEPGKEHRAYLAQYLADGSRRRHGDVPRLDDEAIVAAVSARLPRSA